MTPEDQSSKPKFMQSILKRPAEPTENEKILATRSQAQQVKLQERERQQAYQMKMEAARRIQRCWRNYYNSKKTRQMMSKINELSTENIRRKRLRATQEEWETQIAALTIQLAWRKYYRKKLLSTLHPNRRQLLMWDPEVVALKQQALVNYIYNEHIYAPFWHPTLKVANRPLWHRFIPSSAAVSYNFAVDQYVPWVARIGAQPQMPSSDLPLTPAGVGGFPRGMSQNSSRASSVRSSKTRSEISLETEKRNPNSSKKTTNAMRKS